MNSILSLQVLSVEESGHSVAGFALASSISNHCTHVFDE